MRREKCVGGEWVPLEWEVREGGEGKKKIGEALKLAGSNKSAKRRDLGWLQLEFGDGKFPRVVSREK